jgi:hypothetical protein
MSVNKVKQQHTSQSVWEQKQLIHVWRGFLLVVNLTVFLTSLGCKLISTNSQKLFGTKEAALTYGCPQKTQYSKCILCWSYIKIKMTIFGAYMDSGTLFNNSIALLGYGSHKLKITAINSNPGHMELKEHEKIWGSKR